MARLIVCGMIGAVHNAEGSTITDAERRGAAAEFAADWKDRGDEEQETQAL